MNISRKHQNIFRIFAALAIIYITLAIVGGVINYSTVPWSDMWDGYLNFFIEVTNGNKSAWWTQHNEHRILLAHLLFWIDLSYFKGNGIFLIIVNYLLAASGFSLLYLCLKERLSSADEKFTQQILALLMLALTFSWMQSANLVHAFQSQFYLAQLLPFLAFYLLHKSHLSTYRSTLLFSFACLAGVASIGSMANGVIALPLMVLLAFILRMSWQRAVALMTLTVICICAYFYNYHAPAGHGSLKTALLSTPLDFLQYVLLYLGSPFTFITGKGFYLLPELASLFMIGSALFFANQSLRSPKTCSLQLVLLAFILYVCISAVGTAGGRLIFGLRQAVSSRYTTPTIIAWLCLLILYAPAIQKKMQDGKSHVLWYLLSILLLLLPQQLKALQSKTEKHANYNLATLALTLGINDTPIIQSIYPSAEWALVITANALDKKLSVFADPPFSDARQRLGKVDDERSATVCSGELQVTTQISNDHHYFKVQGWLESKESADIPANIRILDEQGRVVGFALSGFEKTDSSTNNIFYTRRSSFVGYVLAEQIEKNIILSGKNPNCELTALVPRFSNHAQPDHESL